MVRWWVNHSRRFSASDNRTVAADCCRRLLQTTVAWSSGEVSTGKSLRAYHTPSMEHMAHITLYLVFFRVIKEMCVEMCVWRPPAEVSVRRPPPCASSARPPIFALSIYKAVRTVPRNVNPESTCA